MHTYENDSVNKTWYKAVTDLKMQHPIDLVRTSFDEEVSTLELQPAILKINNPRKRILTCRGINIGFALAEVLWIMSGSGKADMISWYNKQMLEYLDEGKDEFNAPYGKRLRRYPTDSENLCYTDQLDIVYEKLKDNPTTRQAVTTIWDPRYDNKITKDPPCNDCQMFKIRDDKLNLSNFIRSNDCVWGTPYNFIQFTFIQEIIAGWLDVEVGNYVHFADSFHMYEKHYKNNAEKIIYFDIYDYYEPVDFRVSREAFDELLYLLLNVEEISRLNPDISIKELNGFLNNFDSAWVNFISTIISYNLFKHGREEDAIMLANINITNEFKPVLFNFFYRKLTKVTENKLFSQLYEKENKGNLINLMKNSFIPEVWDNYVCVL